MLSPRFTQRTTPCSGLVSSFVKINFSMSDVIMPNSFFHSVSTLTMEYSDESTVESFGEHLLPPEIIRKYPPRYVFNHSRISDLNDKQTSFDGSTIESEDGMNHLSPVYNERELVHLMDDNPILLSCFEDSMYTDPTEQMGKVDQSNGRTQSFDGDLKFGSVLAGKESGHLALTHQLSESHEIHIKAEQVYDGCRINLPGPDSRMRIKTGGSLGSADLSTGFLDRSISLPLSKSIAMEFDEDGQRHSFCSEISLRVNTIAYALRQIEMSTDELSLQDRKNVILMLTKDMMENVLHDHISADVATNTIHCAAVLLGFEVAIAIPDDLVFIFDLPPSTSPYHLRSALSAFGHLKGVAVGYGPRTFGIGIFSTAKKLSLENEIFIKTKLLQVYTMHDIKTTRSLPASPSSRFVNSSCFSKNITSTNDDLLNTSPPTQSPQSSTSTSPVSNVSLRRSIFQSFVDEPLQIMRDQVEHKVKDIESLLSYAIISTHMDDMEKYLSKYDIQAYDIVDIDIQAAVFESLFLTLETFGHLGRKDCLYDTLVDVVTLVRSNLLQPDIAATIIHECAAYLDYELLEDVPTTLLIVFNVVQLPENDWLRAFAKYGEIYCHAISMSHNFGLVRYKNQTSVKTALANFRVGRIDIKGSQLEYRGVTSNSHCGLVTVLEHSTQLNHF